MSELNVKHINKILGHIQADIRRLWMPWWGVKKGAECVEQAGKELQFAACGTAACFAGWSKLLSMPKKERDGQFYSKGYLCVSGKLEAERLGLDDSERFLFTEADGTQREQFNEVKKRLRMIIAGRVARGELSAKKIRV